MARLAADGAVGSVNLDRALTSRCCYRSLLSPRSLFGLAFMFRCREWVPRSHRRLGRTVEYGQDYG